MLTDAAIQRAELPAPGKIIKLQDGDGLFVQLEFGTKGARYGWRFRYRWNKKDSLISLGAYPDVSIESAREQRRAAVAQLARGENPAASRRVERAEVAETAERTFARMAHEWLKHDDTLKPKTRLGHERYLKYLAKLHHRPVTEIETREIVEICRGVGTAHGHETAHRTASLADNVLRYCVQSGHLKYNPASQMRGALKPVKETNRAAIIDPRLFGQLMRIIDTPPERPGMVTVTHALQIIARVFLRPGALRKSRWDQIEDLDGANPVWKLSAIDMEKKDSTPLWIPLAPAVVKILKAQKEISGDGRYIFPGPRTGRPISDNTMNMRMKDNLIPSSEHMVHGFRTSASTLLREVGKFPGHLIEFQLGHKLKNQVEAAYNRAEYWDERKAMLIRWCELIDECKLL